MIARIISHEFRCIIDKIPEFFNVNKFFCQVFCEIQQRKQESLSQKNNSHKLYEIVIADLYIAEICDHP